MQNNKTKRKKNKKKNTSTNNDANTNNNARFLFCFQPEGFWEVSEEGPGKEPELDGIDIMSTIVFVVNYK